MGDQIAATPANLALEITEPDRLLAKFFHQKNNESHEQCGSRGKNKQN